MNAIKFELKTTIKWIPNIDFIGQSSVIGIASVDQYPPIAWREIRTGWETFNKFPITWAKQPRLLQSEDAIGSCSVLLDRSHTTINFCVSQIFFFVKQLNHHLNHRAGSLKQSCQSLPYDNWTIPTIHCSNQLTYRHTKCLTPTNKLTAYPMGYGYGSPCFACDCTVLLSC